jgi:hypothetical protein
MTFCTYEDAVRDFTDHNGNLSDADASQLLREHGFSWWDVLADDHGISSEALANNNAEALLAWLGY